MPCRLSCHLCLLSMVCLLAATGVILLVKSLPFQDVIKLFAIPPIPNQSQKLLSYCIMKLFNTPHPDISGDNFPYYHLLFFWCSFLVLDAQISGAFRSWSISPSQEQAPLPGLVHRTWCSSRRRKQVCETSRSRQALFLPACLTSTYSQYTTGSLASNPWTIAHLTLLH